MSAFALWHRTSERFVVGDPRAADGDYRESPGIGGIMAYATAEMAEEARAGLGEFAGAYSVVPVLGLSWPTEFPGAWQDWPEPLERAARQFVVEYYLAEFGPADMVKMLYALGDRRHPDTGEVLPYTAAGADYWPLFLAQARRWYTKRAALAPVVPVHPATLIPEP